MGLAVRFSQGRRLGWCVRVTSLTLVTVVFEPEVPLLAVQARSLDRYVADGVFEAVLVVDNTRAGLGRSAEQRLRRAYGRWGGVVRFVRPDEIAALPPSHGWVGQQVLKLKVGELVETDFYVVLDAKNHWVAPSGVDDFVNPDGRARGSSHSYRQHPLQPTLARTLDYVGLEAEHWLDDFPPTHTPFVISTQTVNALCAEIETRSGRPFAEEFVRAGLAEFFLYSAWLVSTQGGFDLAFDGTTIRSVNVWPGRSAVTDFHRAIASVADSDVLFFAPHRTALAKARPLAVREVAQLWAARGLVSTPAAGVRMLVAFKLRYLVTMPIRKGRRILTSASGRIRTR